MLAGSLQIKTLPFFEREAKIYNVSCQIAVFIRKDSDLTFFFSFFD